MKPGAVVLLTFKNTFHKKAVWEEARDAALTKLKRCLEGVKVVQLFANTPKECSVIGRVAVVS